MDKDAFRSIVNYYQSQLLLGYYKKKGKSLVIPYIIFAINRLVSLKEGQKIRILDVGCGKGDLLQIISEISLSMNVKNSIELYGLDYNGELLAQVKNKNGQVKDVFTRDLRHDILTDLEGRFDIVVSVNTLHEVYSLLLGEDDELGSNRVKNDLVKKRIENLLVMLGDLLSDDGSLIFYDGLNIETQFASKKIRFQIKTRLLNDYFAKFLSGFKPFNLKYKIISEKDQIYEMSYADFHQFIVTFKFLNTDLWPIESRESYAYFSTSEFKSIIRNSKLIIESFVSSSNDLGLWEHNVKIISEGLDFGPKSALIMASKKFLPSEFDHFCT